MNEQQIQAARDAAKQISEPVVVREYTVRYKHAKAWRYDDQQKARIIYHELTEESVTSVTVTWMPGCFGGICLVSLFGGERIITVHLSGGHFLNWTVVHQRVDDQHEIIKGPAFTREKKENYRLLRAAIKNGMNEEIWAAIQHEFFPGEE